jgi:DNA polymerase I
MSEAQLRYAADDATATWGVFDQQWRELVGHGLTEVARWSSPRCRCWPTCSCAASPSTRPAGPGSSARLEAELPALEEAVQAALVTDDSPRDLFGPTPVNLDSPSRSARRSPGSAWTSSPPASTCCATTPRTPRWRRSCATGRSQGHEQLGRRLGERARHPVTGRVHADWRQIVGTGRIACSEPNLTQVPKEARYRSCFGGEPGRMLVVADYSQQELRILAAVSGDEALTEVFRAGRDLHRTTAAMVFAVPEDAVTRRSAPPPSS